MNIITGTINYGERGPRGIGIESVELLEHNVLKITLTDGSYILTDPIHISGEAVDYDSLRGLPKINGVLLVGDKATAELEISYEDLLNLPTLPTKVSDLLNDAGYITSADIAGKQDKLTAGENITIDENNVISATGGGTEDYEDLENKPSINGVELVGNKTTANLNISYNDLKNKPTIPTVPTNVSAFVNDAGYLTEHQSLDNYFTKTEARATFAGLADFNTHTSSTVAHTTAQEKATWNAKSDFSGDYNDLTNKPTIPTVPTNVSAFTNDAGYQTASDVATAIAGKADTDDLASVAFSGDYDDLSNKPTIPSLDGYATEEYVDEGLATKQDTLTAGDNITIENNVISASASGNPDNESIILNGDNELTVSYGGAWSAVYGPEHWRDETLGWSNPDNPATITATGEFIKADNSTSGTYRFAWELLFNSLNTNTLWIWENHGYNADGEEREFFQIHAKPYKVEENATICGDTCNYVIYMRPDEDPFDPDSGAEYINECAWGYTYNEDLDDWIATCYANYSDAILNTEVVKTGFYFAKVYPNLAHVEATPIKPHVIPLPGNRHLYIDEDNECLEVNFSGNAEWGYVPQMVCDQNWGSDYGEEWLTEETYGDFTLLDTEGKTLYAEFPFAKSGEVIFEYEHMEEPGWWHQFQLHGDGENKARLRESSWFERPGYRYLKVDKDWEGSLELEEDLLLAIILDDDHPNTVCGIDFTGATAGVYVLNNDEFRFNRFWIPSYNEKLVHRHLDSKQFPTTLAKVPMAPNSAGSYTAIATVGTDGAEPSYSWISGTLADKQDTLTAGDNITIENNVISATGGGSSYTAGDGIDISSNVISADNTIARVDDIPTVPTNVSAFTNDAGYQTANDVASAIAGKADSADLANVAFSGNYNDLSNKPTIPTVPTVVSAFTNDAGYLTSHQDISGLATKAELEAVEDEIPDITGLASETYVDTQVATKSAVSGTNDGTNWTSLTVDGTTKNIPAGGGSSYTFTNGITESEGTVGLTPTSIRFGKDQVPAWNKSIAFNTPRAYEIPIYDLGRNVSFGVYQFGEKGTTYGCFAVNMSGDSPQTVDGSNNITLINGGQSVINTSRAICLGKGININAPGNDNVKIVLGSFPETITDSSKLLVLGNGTSNTSRSNALTVDWNGNLTCNNIPAQPTTDGTYNLQCSVSSGTASYSWEEQESASGNSF